jgi:cytidylate kinase
MSLPEIAISSEGSTINLEAISSKNPTADKYTTTIDNNSSGKVFRAVFKLENMKMMNFDYKVELSSKGIAKFTSLNNKTWKDEKQEIQTGSQLTYWIATETQSSTFE